MRDVSGLAAHVGSTGTSSRRTGHRQCRFSTLPMRHCYFRFLLLLVAGAFFVFGNAALSLGAGPADSAPEIHAAGAEHGAHAEEHHVLPLKPPPLFHIGNFVVTNSMLVTWFVAAVIILLAQLATRKIQPVPSGLQNFWEWMVESLYNFLESMIGKDLVKKTFWFFATIFIFILFLNWFALIPGVGTIGWGHATAGGGFSVTTPLLRGANADLNLTFAMASIFFVCWMIWAVQANGVGGVIMHLFAPKGDTKGLLKFLMIFIFFVVGWLEIVSILFRPISLSFRLFGNVYAGEIMLESMAMAGGQFFAWLISIPFYFLEVLVGFVQALVFMLLTAVFTLLIASHEGGHETAHH
ncbi:MAG: F0F1 ATP synthase subunit A [Verrucomicrobiota bacterium]|nr:F0F1 ATP synthase subunit A [Verrucomicrobiota bacterium]